MFTNAILGCGLAHIAITGASSGLGAALARHYGKSGAHLLLFGRDSDRLARIAGVCRANGADVKTVACSVTDAPSMDAALRQAHADRPLDLLIANAGIGGAAVLAKGAGEDGALARMILDVNTVGVINTVTPLLEPFAAQRRGHIVIISSVAAFHGLAEAPAYCASKAAIRLYGEGLRRRLGPLGVDVTVVAPGFVETPMSASLPHATPFACTADRAAQLIARAIRRRRSEYVFPWQMKIVTALVNLLPPRLADGLMQIAHTWTAK
jgi:short-subunit dehydrogenase